MATPGTVARPPRYSLPSDQLGVLAFALLAVAMTASLVGWLLAPSVSGTPWQTAVFVGLVALSTLGIGAGSRLAWWIGFAYAVQMAAGSGGLDSGGGLLLASSLVAVVLMVAPPLNPFLRRRAAAASHIR